MPRPRSHSSNSSQPSFPAADDASTNSHGKKKLRDVIKSIGHKHKHRDASGVSSAQHSPVHTREPAHGAVAPLSLPPAATSPTAGRRAVSMGPETTGNLAPASGVSHAATMRNYGTQPSTVPLSMSAGTTNPVTQTPERGRAPTPRSRPSSPSRPSTGDMKQSVSSAALADPVLSMPSPVLDMRSSATSNKTVDAIPSKAEELYRDTPPPTIIHSSTPQGAGMRAAGQSSATTAASNSSAGGFLSSVLNVAHSVLGTHPADEHLTPSKSTGDATPFDTNSLAPPGSGSGHEDPGTAGPPSRAGTGLSSNSRVPRIAEELSPPDAASDTRHREMRSGSLISKRRRESNASAMFGPQDLAGPPQKITGFAVASNKRNREFHATFRSVPEGDYLLDDYGCALQKEILVHGRMYVSESHICFNSNIFGWVTNLVISFNDIISIEKRSTAGIFPNAIQLATRNAKHIFASFISRETTYELIISIWRLTHPAIQTTPHGVEVAPMEDESEDNTADDSGDEDDDEGSGSSVQDSDHAFGLADETFSQHSSSPVLQSTTAPKATAEKSEASEPAGDFPGPREHAPTEAPGLQDTTKFTKQLVDQSVDAPLGQVCALLFGVDVTFMKDFLESNQKLLDVKVGGLSDMGKGNVRKISYVKPLSGPIGPKQTRCLIDDTVEFYDLERAMQVVTSTTTPDVPSGDAFVIKTRVCLMWGPRNTTRVVCHCAIEWSKSSWIKAAIEKAATSGQVDYWSQLVEATRGEMASGGKRKKSKKSGRPRGKSGADEEVQSAETTPATAQPPTGFLSTLTGLFAHVNLNVLLFVILLGMMLMMLRMQRSFQSLAKAGQFGKDNHPLASTDRWAKEEEDLWRWLSQRTSGKHAEPLLGQAQDLRGLQLHEAIEQEQIRLAVLLETAELAKKKAAR